MQISVVLIVVWADRFRHLGFMPEIAYKKRLIADGTAYAS